MKKLVLTVGLIGLIAGLWIAARAWADKLTLSRIVVSGLVHIEESEIVNLVALPDSILLSDIDLNDIRNRVGRHPYVQRVTVNKDFPSTLRVSVEERRPAAIIVATRMAIIDDNGIVLPVRHGELLRDLPVIGGSFTVPQIGETVTSKSIRDALILIQATRDAGEILYHLFSEVHVNEDGTLTLYTTDGGVPVYLGANNDAEKLVAFREFWIQEVVPVGTRYVQSVDLRYYGQILARWSSRPASR